MEFSAEDRHYVKYARICCPLQLHDFTPARVTRESENPLLQDNCAIDQATLYETLRQRHSSAALQLYQFLTRAAEEGGRPLRGKYVELQFADSYPGCDAPASAKRISVSSQPPPVQSCGGSAEEDTPTSPPTLSATLSPLFVRSRTERRRTAFRKRYATKSGCGSASTAEEEEEETDSRSYYSNCSEVGVALELDMEVGSGLVMYHEPAPLAYRGEKTQRATRCGAIVPPRISRGLARPVPFQLPAADAIEEAPQVPPRRAQALTPPASSPECSEPELADEGDPALISSNDDSSAEGVSDDSCDSPQPTFSSDGTGNHHLPLSRQSPQVVPTIPSFPTAPISHSPRRSNSRHSKPLPPPKAKSQSDMYNVSPPQSVSSDVTDTTCKSTPDLHRDGDSSPLLTHRPRCVSFLDSSAGAELGRFPADYLGSRPSDSYIGHADSLARDLINSKPIEVAVYVTSEKIRLAPPRTSSVLFKSFAVKDILSVQKCSKNRRIVCVSVWKSRKTLPQCHILRCPSILVSSALYDSILDQTQSVDDIAANKVSSPNPAAIEAPTSTDITMETASTNNREVPTLPTPVTPDPISPQTPSEFLHKIPAIHVGSTRAGRHDSVNDVIQRVLLGHTPMGSREVSVWLSLAQLRLVDISDEREMVYEAHETNRIRAIGVYHDDKRFIGYIIKEEGKPLVGHVLRCNSAALMVSLVSFLRQACQIMFSQNGGSLYDELSSDESESESSTESPMPGSGILKKLRCIANPHKPLCQSSSHPTFVSHTPPPHSPPSHHPSPSFSNSPSVKESPLSPLDVPEEQFARFSVTYVGSAVTEPPFSQASLSHSLSVFKDGGVAAGKAAVAKNVVQMHVSSLGINLVDKKHRLFVSRNYPKKQLVGVCRHGNDEKLFAFGSLRQGYPNEIKCHVFRRIQEPTTQIMEAIHHWLAMSPSSTTSDTTQ